MTKKLLALLALALLAGCAVAQTPVATTAGEAGATPVPTPEQPDSYQKASVITSLLGAVDVWWDPDGKIICQSCILHDGTRVAWGKIDPLTGYFDALSPEDFQIPSQISQSAIFKNDDILLYSLSPSKEKMILFFEGKPQRKLSLAVYSLSEGSLKDIPLSLDFCRPEGVASFQNWSSDGRYVLASCWMVNTEETLTWFIVDTDGGAIFDLREAIGTNDGVTAAISSDGKRVAVVDYGNSIYLLTLKDLFPVGEAKKEEPQRVQIDTVWVGQMAWSKDDQFIYFDSHRIGEILLCRVNVYTANVETIFDRSKIQTDDNHILPTFLGSWQLSPDNRFILLNHYTLAGDNTLWLFDLGSER